MPSKKRRTPPARPERRGSSARKSPGVESAAEDVAATGRALVLSDRPEDSIPLPSRLPLLPLRSDVVFPQTVVPLVINRPGGIRLIDDAMIGERMVALVSQLHPEMDAPRMEDLYPTVCVGLVLKMLKFPDGSTRIVCQGQY